MNIRDIEAFVAVADSGSLQGAAARLEITQPGVTRRIQALESALDVTLLDRRAKPVRPSVSGLHVLDACRHVLRAVDTLQLVAAPDGEPSGEFRLGIAPGLADVVMSDPLDRLRRRYERLRPSITTAWTAQLVERVRSSVLHAAIVLWVDDDALPSDAASVVGQEDVVVAAAVGRTLKRRPALRDLGDETWILNPPGCGYRRNLERSFAAAGMSLRIAAEATGRDLQLSLIARDLGIGLVPRRVLEQSRYRAKLRVVPVSDFRLCAKITVVPGRDLGPLMQVVDSIKDDVKRTLAAGRPERTTSAA